jgi:hypothetical protein
MRKDVRAKVGRRSHWPQKVNADDRAVLCPMSGGAVRGACAIGSDNAVHRLVGFDGQPSSCLGSAKPHIARYSRGLCFGKLNVATSVGLERHFATLAQIHELVNLITHHGLPVNGTVPSSVRDKLEEKRMSPIEFPVMQEAAAARDTQNSGAVAIGAMTPSFPPVKVSARESKDCNQVRMGAMTPLLP